MKFILPVLFPLICLLSNAQSHLDTCRIKPVNIAYFQKLTPGDSVIAQAIADARTLYSADKRYKISSFIFTIDCDACDIVSRKVIGDSFSKEDLKEILNMRPHSIIFFECIIAKNKDGGYILCKPFYFFSKP